MRNYLRKAIISLLIDDNEDYPRAQLSQYNGIAFDAQRLSPYGLCSQPPEGSLAVVLSPDGNADDPIAIVDDVIRRFKPLQEGEVQVGNYLTRAFVYFKSDGSIDVTAPGSGSINISAGSTGLNISTGGNVTITAPTTTVNGNLAVIGTISATVDVQGGPLNTSLIGHTHTISGGSSAGTTSPPNP